MIYITGDLHATHDVHKLASKMFPEQKQMTKDDYLIICGDFGFVWAGDKEEAYWFKWLDAKNFTTLFVDGNHENHQLLNNYTVTEYCGGKVHNIYGSIYHLMRGQIYTIDGHTFFAMGGAVSTDKQQRVEGISWWPEEVPSKQEYYEALSNLKTYNNAVDFIITHCAPESIQEQISEYDRASELSEFLEDIKNEVSYKHWYFGHYHKNEYIDDKHTALYGEVLRLC